MRLTTLGGLALEGTPLTRRVPLLLLAYLALEGERARTHLSELFWPAARDPRGALRGALTRLRRAAPGCVRSRGDRLASDLPTDVATLRGALARGALDDALDAYQGPFLDGVRFDAARGELEEWAYATRERLAEEVRLALTAAAEEAMARGHEARARTRAELAYTLPGAAPADPELLGRLDPILHGGDSALARLAHVEAGRYGVALAEPSRAPRRPIAHVRLDRRPPHRPTRFVGRDHELRALTDLLGDPRERLITVVGAPGVGKSRLAARAVEAWAAAHGANEGAVTAVSAAGFLDPARIPESMADALGLEPGPELDARACCARALGRGGPRVLLLDDFDAVVDGASCLAELLRSCPDLTVLVTSRHRLHLQAERVVAVDPLPFEGEASPALELFEDRARRADPQLAWGPSQRSDARRICRAVGGSPLGLELAATWARALPLPELADEVERTLGFLDAPTQDAPPRERSLRAAVAYSWDLLADRERRVLRRLGAFHGGFSRRAAAAVAGADARTLAALVDASLVELGADERYHLHPVVADFARHQLDTCPRVATATRRRHRRHFVGRLDAWRTALRGGSDQARTLARIGRELGNLQLAWDEALRHGRGADLYALARSMAMYFELAHRFREGTDVLLRSEAELDPGCEAHRAALGSVHACWAWHHLRVAEPETALRRARTALELLEAHGDAEGAADARHALAATLLAMGRTEEARAEAERALAQTRDAGLERDRARLLVLLAGVDAAASRPTRARARLAEAIEVFEALDDRRGRGRTLLAAAEVARRDGDWSAARDDLRAALEVSEREGMDEEARRARTLLASLPAGVRPGRRPSVR